MPVDLQTAAHPLLVVLAAAACGAFAWWSYGRTTPPMTGGRRVLLAALRGTTLFAVFLLLFEPALRRVVERADAPLVAVLVDVSRSIAADPGRIHFRMMIPPRRLAPGVRAPGGGCTPRHLNG